MCCAGETVKDEVSFQNAVRVGMVPALLFLVVKIGPV